MSTPSEPKTGLPNFLAVIGIAIAVIGVLAGLAQLEPVRNLACEKGSILCKREHKVEFFKISYSGSAPERSAWDVVLNGKRLFDRNYRNRDNTECIDDDGMSTFLAVNQAIREEKGFHISYGSGPSLITTNPYPATDWRFETHPLDVGKNISMDGGDIILFHLISRYTLLVRDINSSTPRSMTVGDSFPNKVLNEQFFFEKDHTKTKYSVNCSSRIRTKYLIIGSLSKTMSGIGTTRLRYR